MIRLLLVWAIAVALAENSYVVANSFVVSLSDPKAGYRNLRKLGFQIKVLSDKHLLISKGPESTKIYSISDDAECLRLKMAVEQVSDCSPNHVYSLSSRIQDTLVPNQWGLRAVEANEQIWDETSGESVVVAVTDTGVDYTHADLAENIYFNLDEIPNDGIDNDNNGYVDDVVGWSGVTNNGLSMDRHGHGTHVAGIIAAQINGFGVVGVAPRAKILPVKVLNDQGYGNLATIVAGLNYVKTLRTRGVNIRVINASWGGGAHSTVLQNLINELHGLGVVFVAAAGNSASNNDHHPTYPANYINSVSVASIDESRLISFFSNYGNSVHIGAPGSAIVSTLPDGRYGSMSGTSMAAPFVSGALALFFDKYPSLTASEAVSVLLDTCVKNPDIADKIRNGCTLNVRTLLARESQQPPSMNPDDFRLVRNLDSLSFGHVGTLSNTLAFTNNDEGEARINVENLSYNGVPINSITVSSNFLLYLDGNRNIFDFLPITQLFGNLRRAISLLSSDWIVRHASFSTNDGLTIFMAGRHYANKNADIKVALSMYEQGGYRLRYSINRTAWNSDLRNELRIVFFGNSTSRRYANFRPIHPNATFNLAPDKNYSLRIDKLAIGANPTGLAVQAYGAGSGSIYGYFYINGRKCQKRVPVALVHGHGRRLSVLNQVPNYSIVFRGILPDNHSKSARLDNRKIKGLHLVSTTRFTVDDACRMLTR